MNYELTYPTEKKEKDQYKPAHSHAIISLTIKQLLSLTKDNEIEYQTFNHIIIMGKLISVLQETNKRKLKVSDGTGVLELILLIGDEKSKIEGEGLESKLGLYFFIACTPKLKREGN